MPISALALQCRSADNAAQVGRGPAVAAWRWLDAALLEALQERQQLV